MKTIASIFLTLIFFSNVLAGDDENIQANWLYNIDEVKKIAKEENKDILISFSGSDWCIPCMRLKRDLFETEIFKTYASENLVLLKLDFPARKQNKLPEDQLKHNEALAELYNKKGEFPKVIIVNAEGNAKGFMEHPKSNPASYIESIEKLITK